MAKVSLMLIALLAFGARGDFIDEAQLAAKEGRYDSVVAILSRAIETSDLDPERLVLAHSNRGIAYSLLGDYARARRDLEAAISLDPLHALTLNHLGMLAEHVDRRPIAAARYYEQAATAGFAAAQVNLAELYRQGKGVARDDSKALALYVEATRQDYPMAYVPLGRMYRQGLGVDQDLQRALNLFVRAAQNGVVEAHFYLGGAYERGEGVRADKAVAMRHYEVAAMQGHGRAQNALGDLYRTGTGVEQNLVEAVKWYRLAADQGVLQAMNRLAWLLATCPVAQVCNGVMAVELAEAAVERDDSPANRDSLAAAYARTGQFDRAVKTVKQALSDLAPDSPEHEKYREHLRHYQRGVPLSFNSL